MADDIKVSEEDSGIGVFLLSSSSVCFSILILIIIGIGMYMYYRTGGQYIQLLLDKLPFLQKFIKMPSRGSDTESEIQKLKESQLTYNSSSSPTGLSSTSTNTKTFNKNAGNQMLMQQASDKCNSEIAGGLCGNLVKGDCSLSITDKGNLVLKKGDTVLWDSDSTKDRPNTTYTLNITNVGNLIVLTNERNPVWSNNINGKSEEGPYTLILRDDNNLVIENNLKQVVWETGTAGGKISKVLEDRANTGYIPSDPSIWIPYREKSTTLPSSFKIQSPFDPTDQYDVSTCVPSQILGVFSYNYWKLYNKQYMFSRLFTFYWGRVDAGSDATKNDGSSAQNIYECIRNRGLLLEKYYAYDGTTSEGKSGTKNKCSVQKYQEKPQDELLDIAKKNIPTFRIYRIDTGPDLITILKTAIYNRKPVLFAFLPCKSYWSDNTKTTGEITYPQANEERLSSGHQVSMWGWDDSKQIFHVLNTRGPDYYNKGWNTIPYKYIEDGLADGFHIIDFDESTSDIVDEPNYINKEDWVFKKDLGCPYVNTVQKGVECYEPPPSGYDWTTEGGLMIGKVCPSGTNDSGTTCWYDRGAGRIPDLTPCPDGWRDDGTVCWLDTYGRGAGRAPGYGPCPPRSREGAAGDCYADVVDREDGRNDAEPWGKSWDKSEGCSWNRHIEAAMCFRACPDGYFGRAHERCWANGADSFGVMKRSADRLQCNADEDKDGLLCYPKCKSGYHAVGCCLCEPDGGVKRIELSSRQKCADDEEMKDGLCYKKCKEGFNAGVTICEFSKDVKLGTKKNLVSNCK